MQLLGIKTEEDLTAVINTFMNVNKDWTVVQHDKERHPGWPAAAVTILDRQTKVMNIHFISVDSVLRVAQTVQVE